MKKFLIIAFISTMMLGLGACTKSDDNTTTTPATTAPTKAELLTAKKWLRTSIVLNGTDIFPTFDACDKDDFHIFKAGGVFNADNGPTKCDPADDQIFTVSTWALSANDTKLTFDGDEFTIVELTATSMKLTISDGADNATVTYVGQ